MTEAAPDTTRQEFAALRAAAEDYKGGRWDSLKASSKWGLNQALDWFNPTTTLSLLDRIEELEREVAELATEEGQWQPPYKPMSPEVRAILDKYRV